MRAEREELADGDADGSREELAEDGVAGLGEGGFDRVEVEDCGGALLLATN